ncbi:hypothetical protein ABEB36_004913 [Hypothenemus hampei]|uniref:Vacuolar protein-sorting-associated protein 36 n=1 Tax=Hypothenemus hampei TaxID=57062 RepID=A0ABD1EWV4_HYPHA
MDRFRNVTPLLMDNERTLTCENNVRLYDGPEKTHFEGGELVITTHRILWGRTGAIAKGQTCLALYHNLIIYFEEEPSSAFSFSRSRKIAIHVNQLDDPTADKVVPFSRYQFIKLSFRNGFSSDVVVILRNCLEQRYWEQGTSLSSTRDIQNSLPEIKLRSGIGGIERSLQEKQKATNETLSIAFQDLDKLMEKAKEMVRLSQMISTKIKERQGDITEDETVRFKSYLLSLGIDDPVTRDSYKTNSSYYKSLAKEISDFLLSHIEEMGGMMALTDVYCRINRARGLELLSPEDVLNACKLMEQSGMPLKLYEFNSGVKVLQLRSLDSDSIAEATADLVANNNSMNAEELSQRLGISLTLAKERLLVSEKFGKCCRDDAIEGLRFYPNLFLTKEE